MKLQNQTAVKIEPQYGLAAIDAYLESEAAAYRMGDVASSPAEAPQLERARISAFGTTQTKFNPAPHHKC
jgi:hypothetical protein